MQIKTSGLLAIENRRLLLAYSKNKQCFYLPGGKINDDEGAIQALCREVAEELNVVLTEGDLEFYCHITAPAYGEKAEMTMEQDCFLITKRIVPSPSAEISAVKYFSRAEYLAEEKQAPGAAMILGYLRKDGYID